MIAQLEPLYIKTRPLKVVTRLLSYALFEGRPLTTMGRWINPFVFGHFWVEKRLPQLKEVVKPIFIIGTGRSGSTILGVVLSMHKDVGFLNEPKALWHTIYPEEDVVGNYASGPARYRLDKKDANDAVKRTAHRLFGAYQTITLSGRVVDKYPELIFRIPFVKEIFPDAKFIFLARNGWSTCHSIERWSKKKGVARSEEVHDWWGVNNRKWKLMLEELILRDPAFSRIAAVVSRYTAHTDMAAAEWIVTMREGLRRMKDDPDSIYMVKYEDLVKNPRIVLSELTAFCELPHDEKLYSYAERILSPAPDSPPPHIDSAIRPLFDETIEMLGYC